MAAKQATTYISSPSSSSSSSSSSNKLTNENSGLERDFSDSDLDFDAQLMKSLRSEGSIIDMEPATAIQGSPICEFFLAGVPCKHEECRFDIVDILDKKCMHGFGCESVFHLGSGRYKNLLRYKGRACITCDYRHPLETKQLFFERMGMKPVTVEKPVAVKKPVANLQINIINVDDTDDGDLSFKLTHQCGTTCFEVSSMDWKNIVKDSAIGDKDFELIFSDYNGYITIGYLYNEGTLNLGVSRMGGCESGLLDCVFNVCHNNIIEELTKIKSLIK